MTNNYCAIFPNVVLESGRPKIKLQPNVGKYSLVGCVPAQGPHKLTASTRQAWV